MKAFLVDCDHTLIVKGSLWADCLLRALFFRNVVLDADGRQGTVNNEIETREKLQKKVQAPVLVAVHPLWGANAIGERTTCSESCHAYRLEYSTTSTCQLSELSCSLHRKVADYVVSVGFRRKELLRREKAQMWEGVE